MKDTRFSFMSDAEFIAFIKDKRDRSPIIEELCARIEESPGFNTSECPVCEADLAEK